MQCNREHLVAFITFGDLAVWQYFRVVDRVSYGMGYGRIFMANKKEINRNNNNKAMQNNSNKNSLLCLVVAFFFNFIKSSHSVISIIPFFITFLMNFQYLCFRWTTHQWHCGYDFASEWTVMLLLFFLFSHRQPHYSFTQYSAHASFISYIKGHDQVCL